MTLNSNPIIKTLTSVIATRDKLTYKHSLRVTRLSLLLGEYLGFSEKEMKDLYIGSLLHDIGKIGIGDNILLKQGKLTKMEFEKIRAHPKIGAKLVQSIGALSNAIPIILHHHERFDGLGYPLGLKGADIPVSVKIVSISDAFEAMTADRPYRKAFAFEIAMRELQRNSGSQFDPEIVKAFMGIIKKDTPTGFSMPRNITRLLEST